MVLIWNGQPAHLVIYPFRCLSGEFEDNPPNRDIPKLIEVILKALGCIMVILGIIWFWFSEEFYHFWFF